MGRTSRIGSALLLCTVLTAGSTPPPAAATEPGTGQPTVPQVAWGACARFIGDAAADLPTAQCTTVSVPIADANPAGPQAQLAVIKIPASGQRIGALFVNPGGPGASAVDAVAGMGYSLAGSPITEHFDLVGFDPRGVGYSTPEARCRTDAEFDAWRRNPMVDFSPAGVAAIEQVYRNYAAECADKLGTAFLASVGTDSAAKDMDTIRQLLGDDQINYLGFSYGTQLGTEYVDRFPDRVRAMVLDGAIDPAEDTVDSIVQQMASFQTAFTDYAADCAKSAGCPLGTDPAQWVNRFHQLVDPLVARPGLTSEPRGLSYQDAITGTFNALYTPQYWKFLTSGLLGLQRQNDAGDLLMLADEYNGRDPYGHYSSGQDAFNAVRCVDNQTPTDPAVWADVDKRTRESAPFQSYGQFTGYAPRDVCAFWPVPATSSPHPASPAPPGSVVVVSTTHDPATPYEAGVSLAGQLGAALVTFDGTQHTAVFNGDQCIDSAIVRYFVDQVVPDNLHC